MPNGDDKSVVRLTLTLKAYKNEFSEWPTDLLVSRGIWEHGITPYLSAPALDALFSHVKVSISDLDGETIRAEGKGGSVDYRKFDHRELGSVPPLSDWLGDAWRD